VAGVSTSTSLHNGQQHLHHLPVGAPLPTAGAHWLVIGGIVVAAPQVRTCDRRRSVGEVTGGRIPRSVVRIHTIYTQTPGARARHAHVRIFRCQGLHGHVIVLEHRPLHRARHDLFLAEATAVARLPIQNGQGFCTAVAAAKLAGKVAVGLAQAFEVDNFAAGREELCRVP
jgi:hypothetical protein